MTTEHIASKALVYNGAVIRDRNDMLSLTDMWKAQGSDIARKPSEWLRQEGAQRFIEFLAESQGVSEVGNSHFGLVSISKGGAERGATFAHWQIGLAYAKYLSPEFHMWCNEVVRERMEGKPALTDQHLTKYDAAVIGNIVKNCTGVVLKEQLSVLLPTMLDAMVAAKLAEQSYLLRKGKTAGQIWRDHGFPRIRVTSWFSNRLCAMGCQIEGGGRGELGMFTAKLFDPDKADNWLRNGGNKLVREYIATRSGQTVMRLVQPMAAE